MIPSSRLSFAQCVQVKFRPKKKVKIKASIVLWPWGQWDEEEGVKAVKHDMNFWNFFNMISFIISNKA